jgi:hypothetical protein
MQKAAEYAVFKIKLWNASMLHETMGMSEIIL